MKIITLLIAAATLAVGAISSQAQVYSQNTVGYINQVLPAGKFAIVGSQLINGSDVNATNGDINVTLGAGCISSPSASPATSTNTALLNWNTVVSAFQTFYYYTAADANTAFGGSSHTDGWYAPNGTKTTILLKNGGACFLHNTAAIALTNTSTGTINQGTTFGTGVTIAGNKFNLINNVVPVVTNLCVDASGAQLTYGLPIASLTSSPNPSTSGLNDKILIWNSTVSAYVTYYFYSAADANTLFGGSSHVPGFYAANGTIMPASNWPNVNNGYFLYHIGSSFSYTPTFTIP